MNVDQELDNQIQTLIDQAPPDGTTPNLVASVAPALKLLAKQLRHLQYYIVQTLEQDWVMLTLSNRTEPELQKNVIYAFPTLKDVSTGPYTLQDPGLIALPIPVIHILFQIIGMSQADSAIFFETPGNVAAGTEIQRQDIQHLLQQVWQNSTPEASPNLPSDIA